MDSYVWSRTGRGYTMPNFVEAFNLGFNAARVNSANNVYRYLGLPVRCLVILSYVAG